MVQSLGCVRLFATSWTAACHASLSFTIFWSFLKFCLLSPWCYLTISSSAAHFSFCFQSFWASRSFLIFSLHLVAKVLGTSASANPSNEYSGLISFRIDWFDLPALQGTLKSLLQHQSSKASVLWYSAFFTVQISHPYMTTGKTIALTRQTFVGKVISLLFNMLSRLVITFLLG